MRTTIDLPDDLAIEAKKRAAELRKPLRALIEEGLRVRLGMTDAIVAPQERKIRWITVDGELADDLELSDREKMMDWIGKNEP